MMNKDSSRQRRLRREVEREGGAESKEKGGTSDDAQREDKARNLLNLIG